MKQGVDYFQFERLPRLGGGLIVDDQQAIQRLRTLVEEMEDRYRWLKAPKANNITSYTEDGKNWHIDRYKLDDASPTRQRVNQ